MNSVFKKQKLTAFTLVELIVVITILAILWTIGFISIQKYAQYARESRRLSDMKTIEKWLELFKTSNSYYPDPENSTSVTYSGSILFTQWIIWEKVSGTIRVNPLPVDPISNLPYAYSVSANRFEYQIAWVFENPVSSIWLVWTQETYAAKRTGYVRLWWQYNWVLTLSNTGWLSYVLALPSLFTADFTNPDITSIYANRNIIINGGTNLPAHYSSLVWSEELSYTMTWGVNFWNPNFIVFSWDLESLINEAPRLSFFKNLYSIYTTGDTVNNKYYDEITQLNPNVDPTKAKNYVADVIWYGVAGLYVENFNDRVIRGAIDWFNIFSFWDVGLLSNGIEAIAEWINGEMVFWSDVWVSILKDNTWKNFTGSNTANGLKNDVVRRVYIDPDTWDYYFSHNLWVSKYDGTAWTQYQFGGLIWTSWAWNVTKDKNWNFWIRTWKWLIKIENGTMTAITTTLADPNLSWDFIINPAKDTLYIPSKTWVVVYNIDANTSTIYNYTNSDVFCETCGWNNVVYELLLWNNWDVWMDKHYQELYNMNLTTGSGTRYTDLRNGSTFWRTNRADLAKDNAWKLHFPTWENISTFDGTSWWLITPADGMVGWEKSFAFFDKKNELWVWSRSEWISKFNGSNWTSYSVSPTLATNTIYDIYIDSDSKVWIWTDIWFYIINTDKTWKLYSTSNLALSRSEIKRFYEYNWKLFLSHGYGMSLLNPQTMEVIKTFNEPGWSFYTDTLWELWLATYNWVKKYDWTSFNLVYSTWNWDNILSSNVHDMTQDIDGNFWFATQSGVSKLEWTTWVNYPWEYPNQIEFYNGSIFVNGNKGLRKFDGVAFKTYTSSDWIPSSTITDLIVDDKDNLWLWTDKWIAIYLPETEKFKTYDSTIGIINDSINSIFIKWKEVWLATAGWIAKWVLKQ